MHCAGLLASAELVEGWLYSEFCIMTTIDFAQIQLKQYIVKKHITKHIVSKQDVVKSCVSILIEISGRINIGTNKILKSAQRDTNLRAGSVQPDRTF